MAKKEKKSENCKCLKAITDLVRKKLDAPDGEIDYAMIMNPGEMVIVPRMRFQYHKLKNGVPMKKKEDYSIIPTYCPFCGKKFHGITGT